MDAKGNVALESSARLFSTTCASSSTAPTSTLLPTTFPCLPPHEFYNDGRLSIGHTRYFTTPGHSIVALASGEDLFSIPLGDFLATLDQIRTAASVLRGYYSVGRFALVADGGDTFSLLPLHGLSEDWKPITSDVKEFHEAYPGYVSSKDGPPMEPQRLSEICQRIKAVSGLSAPFNYHFDGSPDDKNLFARLVRGDLTQYRVWEDEEHVAFLTPFPNTPGFTVLVPRTHLSSDIFSIDRDRYRKLMTAVHKVAGILKEAFGTTRCGMIFEGFEIDYAHVKLIPIHKTERAGNGSLPAPQDSPIVSVAPFHETYQGYLSSLNGPFSPEFESLVQATLDLRKRFPVDVVSPPKSWSSPSNHLASAPESPWYKHLFTAQDALFHDSVDFFQKRLGYKYCFVPATTDAVSSPVGLGSDSEPVPIDFLGQKTHLADSMQFALEYYLRIQPGLPGVYYINTSFRGEDPGAMQLNQFYHVECELLGPFSTGIAVAENYILHLVSSLLQDYEHLVKSTAGSTDHLRALLQHYHTNGGKFPQVTLEDALSLVPDSNCWKYVVPSDPSRGRAVTRAGELKLIEHFGGAVWLTEMDYLSVPFYQAFVDDTATKALCADLLLGNGEVLGLGQRHVSAKDVLRALQQHEVPAEPYAWYTEIRERKLMLSTGWGMGIERFLAWVFSCNDIRDLSIVPRMKGIPFAP